MIKVPKMYRYLALIWFFFAVFGLLLIRLPPKPSETGNSTVDEINPSILPEGMGNYFLISI